MNGAVAARNVPRGVQLPGRKAASTSQPIVQLPLPEQLVLALGQHMGAPSTPRVQVGERVLGGQTVAERSPGISTDIHAPSSGTVTAIEAMPIAHPSGLPDLCIALAPDGKDEWRAQEPLDISRTEPARVRERIAGAGIVGMGGAGFPAAMKLPRDAIHTLIVNGVECEPYISSDDMLMRSYSEEIVRGIAVLSKILALGKILVAIEDNKPEASAAMSSALRRETEIDCEHVDVVDTPTRYPSGGEKQLIQMLLGAEVPSSGLPAELGVVCQNIGTVHAIAQAVCEDRPLVQRVVTLTGNALARPGNYLCPVGAPVLHLLRHGAYDADKLDTLIVGGPMMGFEIQDSSVPITKTSNCIIAGTRAELPRPPAQRACIRCGLCAEVCPAELLPQQLYWFARGKEYERLEQHHLFDCIECGACSWVCPSHIPLVQYYRSAKGEITHRKAVEEMAQQSKRRFDVHQERLAKSKKLMEARRKQRRTRLRKSISDEKRREIASASARAGHDSSKRSSR